MSWIEKRHGEHERQTRPLSNQLAEQREAQEQSWFDDAWHRINAAPDWEAKWWELCRAETPAHMCPGLDRKCESRWGEQWVIERTRQRKIVAALFRQAIEAIGRQTNKPAKPEGGRDER